jgi:subtilisin family serine protease
MTPMLALGLIVALAGCSGESPLTSSDAGSLPRVAPVPVDNTALELEFVLELKQGYFPMAVWSDYDLVPEELMANGRTWRMQYSGGANFDHVLDRLRQDPRVQYVEENKPATFPTIRQSSMSFNEGSLQPGEFYDQSLVDRLKLRTAHSMARGYGVTVAILDTGIDLDHPLFAGRIHPAAWDFIDRDPVPAEHPDGIDGDEDGLVDEALGHGSHVAGLVALMAPGAKIMPLRVLDNDGQGSSYGVASAIEHAIHNGARIINLSLRMTEESAAMSRAIALAREKGVLIVAAAGNTGTWGPLDFPASDPYVLAVGSVDAEGRRSAFSAWSSGIGVSAPGENLLSAYWNGGYAVWSGTSMAAPIVTGTAALLMSNNLRYTAEGARARLERSARSLQASGYGMGAGIVAPDLAVGVPEIPLGPNSESLRRGFDHN